MTKQNFYQGQRVGPEEMNGITAYAEASLGHLAASTLGLGLVQGFASEIVNGFVAGIGPGLAYNARGQRLQLDSGVQVNLAAYTPAVGNKTVLLGLVPAIIPENPAIDSMGNTVYRHHTESVEFVHGPSLPEDALPLCEVSLSPVGIIGFRPMAPLLETPLAQSKRTQGYAYNGGNPKITAPNGFEVDLLTLATRRAVFDALKPGGYKKGDIIWLEPPTYDTQTTPPAGGGISYPYTVPAEQAFMGRVRTYSAQTNCRQYAVRLRAMVDNPRNPAEIGAVGTDWAVDETHAIVEKGSNSNGSYEIYADGTAKIVLSKQQAYSGILFTIALYYPVTLATKNHLIYGANGTSSSVSLTPYYNPGDFNLSTITVRGYEVNGSPSSGTVHINVEVYGGI